jgi:hypothetical protein
VRERPFPSSELPDAPDSLTRTRANGLVTVAELAAHRATRSKSEPPSDAEIERALREREVSDPRAAESLLRWLQRVCPPEATPGVDLDSLSEPQLQRLHAGLVKLASMDDTVLAALVGQVLAGAEWDSSS